MSIAPENVEIKIESGKKKKYFKKKQLKDKIEIDTYIKDNLFQ